MTTKWRIRIRKVSVADEIKRLERLVARYEWRYECSSEAALSAVQAGIMRETAEVAEWLITYWDLKTLQELQAGDEAGSRSKTT